MLKGCDVALYWLYIAYDNVIEDNINNNNVDKDSYNNCNELVPDDKDKNLALAIFFSLNHTK